MPVPTDVLIADDEPEVVDNREQVLDPMTAYQITSMMQGVILRGTAAGKIKLESALRPLPFARWRSGPAAR